MRRLVFQPTRMERGLFRDAYDELSTALTEQGWTVIEPRAEYEERGGGRGPVWDGISLAIHLSEEIGHDALAVMVGVVLSKVGKLWPGRGPRRQPREAVIYGPDRRVLKRFSLEDDEADTG